MKGTQLFVKISIVGQAGVSLHCQCVILSGSLLIRLCNGGGVFTQGSQILSVDKSDGSRKETDTSDVAYSENAQMIRGLNAGVSRLIY